MNKISILLPFYNTELFISKSIESILNSSFINFQLILIDDGSTDSSFKIASGYQDKRIVIYHKLNSGLIETLNYGLKKCKHEIIMRMDADDLIHPDKIRRQLEFFKKSGSILTGTQGYLIDNKDKIIGDINLPLHHKNIIKSINKISPSFIHPSVMFYKEALIKSGGYIKYFKHAEDYELFLRLSKIGSVSNLKDRLIFLRKHENSVSHKYAEEQIQNSLIAKELYSKKNHPFISQKVYLVAKKKVQNNILKFVYIKVHTKISEIDYSSLKLILMLKLPLKIVRRILKLFL